MLHQRCVEHSACSPLRGQCTREQADRDIEWSQCGIAGMHVSLLLSTSGAFNVYLPASQVP